MNVKQTEYHRVLLTQEWSASIYQDPFSVDVVRRGMKVMVIFVQTWTNVWLFQTADAVHWWHVTIQSDLEFAGPALSDIKAMEYMFLERVLQFK